MIKLIVATDCNNGIAKDGKIPWKNKEDLSFFKDMTIGMGHNAIVMGRKTSETLPYPLPKRDNYIISRGNGIGIKDIIPLDDQYTDVWVIGGESIYSQVIKKKIVDEVYISVLPDDYECDQFFEKFILDKDYKIDNIIECKTFTLEVWKKIK